MIGKIQVLTEETERQKFLQKLEERSMYLKPKYIMKKVVFV